MLCKALRKLPKYCESGRYSLTTMLFEDCNIATFGEGFKRHLEEGLFQPAAASCRTRQSILQQQKTVKISWAQQGLQVQDGEGLLGFCTVVLGWLASARGLRQHSSAVALGLIEAWGWWHLPDTEIPQASTSASTIQCHY